MRVNLQVAGKIDSRFDDLFGSHITINIGSSMIFDVHLREASGQSTDERTMVENRACPSWVLQFMSKISSQVTRSHD